MNVSETGTNLVEGRPLVEPRTNRGTAVRDFSLVLRRCHLYIGLFLTPWLTMYAVSTVVFNHWERISSFYQGHMDQFEREKEIAYTHVFSPGTTPRVKGERILDDLNLAGSFTVDKAKDRLVINRRDPIAPRRITYIPAEKKLIIERQPFRSANFLTTLHSQVGYTNKLKRIKLWAICVDATAIATVLLVLSGFWMWWELKATRRLGLAFAAFGFLLFTLFLTYA